MHTFTVHHIDGKSSLTITADDFEISDAWIVFTVDGEAVAVFPQSAILSAIRDDAEVK